MTLPRPAALLILCLATLMQAACSRTGVTIATEHSTLTADDGYKLKRYRLMDWDGGRPRFTKTHGVVYYVQGSDDASALNATERLAAAAAMGLDVLMIERRGVTDRGLTAPADAEQFATKQTRVGDTLTLIRDDLARRAPGGPIILCGASEGGDVAAAVAAREPRLTHLVLLGSGGGMTQAEELLSTWQQLPPQLNIRSQADLHAVFADIRANPQADKRWYGHPYRRWATYAFDRPLDDLLKVTAPILLIHGDADASVPVASARAVRDAFAAAGRTNLTYREYAGADHRFIRAGGGSVFPRVEVDLVVWLRDTGGMPAGHADEFVRRVKRAHPDVFVN
ncbi:MAG TPA: alpha/beta hydrolase [Phycisphaerales bacterium]|nr:alpha/beta hydrolase [Phycisphaerales bacterium]